MKLGISFKGVQEKKSKFLLLKTVQILFPETELMLSQFRKVKNVLVGDSDLLPYALEFGIMGLQGQRIPIRISSFEKTLRRKDGSKVNTLHNEHRFGTVGYCWLTKQLIIVRARVYFEKK
jgi:hypothetical protein